MVGGFYVRSGSLGDVDLPLIFAQVQRSIVTIQTGPGSPWLCTGYVAVGSNDDREGGVYLVQDDDRAHRRNLAVSPLKVAPEADGSKRWTQCLF